MAKFLMTETIHSEKVHTARLGTGANDAALYSSKEAGKFVKMTNDSRYELCAAGDPIHGVISSVNVGKVDGYTIGGVVKTGYKEVTFDGSEAAGTGPIAVGDFVVCGTVVAKDTALSVPAKVRKATVQPGATPSDLAGAGVAVRNAMYAWKVVSLGKAGTGAVGTVGLIERVSGF